MPLPVITDGYLIAQRLDSTDELHEMETVHCITTTDTSLSHIADGFASAYYGTLFNNVTHALKIGSTRVTPLDGTSPGEDFVTPAFGNVGGHTTGVTILPWSCARGVTWQTTHRGKSYRGRTYLPGVVDDQVVTSVLRELTTTALSAWQTDVTDFVSGLGALTPPQTLVVLSRKLGVANVVVNARANIGVVEQRRRYERVAHR